MKTTLQKNRRIICLTLLGFIMSVAGSASWGQEGTPESNQDTKTTTTITGSFTLPQDFNGRFEWSDFNERIHEMSKKGAKLEKLIDEIMKTAYESNF